MIIMYKNESELVKARFEYFKQFTKNNAVAYKMATDKLSNGRFMWASGVDQ